MRFIASSSLTLALICSSANSCDMNLSNGVGPWDYGDPKNHTRNSANPMGNVKRVTNVHLTQSMLNLQRGGTSATIGGDLDYTLRAIPNHPQALLLSSRLERLVLMKLAHKYERMAKTAECYFQRAIKLNPRLDSTRIVYGIHLHSQKKYADALKQYQLAFNTGSTSANLHYNMALTLIEMKRFDEAQQHAKKAYRMGFPLMGLKEKLESIGHPI